VHLAAALELVDDLAGVVTYDDRLAAAARLQGITAIAPTRKVGPRARASLPTLLRGGPPSLTAAASHWRDAPAAARQ
jgi:nicotinate-nucleotide pyrophosphorylase